MLCSVEWCIPTFRNNLSACQTIQEFFLDYLTLEEEVDILSRNVGKYYQSALRIIQEESRPYLHSNGNMNHAWFTVINSESLRVEGAIGSTTLLAGGSRDRSPVASMGIFSEATDGTMCPGFGSASKNEYQETSWG
jgi:hypothetical protein